MSRLPMLKDDRWLFRRSLVIDGNFSAEHLKMSRAEKDVKLVNGEGYMVEESRYQQHLSENLEIPEVCSLKGGNTCF
jgi:hypothetical protein